MTRTKTIELYTFDELPDDAKERARDWYRQFVFSDSADWEYIFEDAAECGQILGIDLHQRLVKLVNGGVRHKPAIYFSGFSSQGDGAYFESAYEYAPDSCMAIREYAPQDETLHAIADSLRDAQRPCFYKLAARTCQHHIAHGNNMHVYVDDSDVPEQVGPYTVSESSESIADALHDFANWIYRRLEAEYEYQMSDEAVDEPLRVNEYEFTEDGHIS